MNITFHKMMKPGTKSVNIHDLSCIIVRLLAKSTCLKRAEPFSSHTHDNLSESQSKCLRPRFASSS
jgi:hypothetical protein